MLVERGDWRQCLELAEKTNPDTLNKYLMKYAKFTMEAGQFGEAVSTFAKYGFTGHTPNYPIYKTLVLEVFLECDPKEILDLRTVLYNFQKLLYDRGESNQPAAKVKFSVLI